MKFFSEFEELKKSILPPICLWIGVSCLLFIFGLKEVRISGTMLFLPWPAVNSFSAMVFRKILSDLLPAGVHLMATDPLSAFSAQALISLTLAFICTFPFSLYKFAGYLAPAMLNKEKLLAARVLAPSTALFFLGCGFAYFILIPSTFRILYGYTTVIGAVPYFSVGEFISWVAGIMAAVGIMFLLPVFMVLLSFLGLVPSGLWAKYWRHALLSFLVFSAIITPDGTGVTMLMLAVPLAGLYLLGMCITARK